MFCTYSKSTASEASQATVNDVYRMFVIELDLSENVIEMDLCAVDLLDRIENTGRTASRSKDPSINQPSKQASEQARRHHNDTRHDRKP